MTHLSRLVYQKQKGLWPLSMIFPHHAIVSLFPGYMVLLIIIDGSPSSNQRVSVMVNEFIDELRILGSTNTQTRRLGYVVQICKLLADSHAPMTVLQKRLEDWSEKNNLALKDHVSSKGRLSRSPRSYGSKRYIQLARDLHLITDVSGLLRPTITGRVLLEIDDESQKNNPFKLGSRTALLLFYQLLLLDADYLLPIFRSTRFYHKQSQLLEGSQEQTIRRFEIMEARIQSPLLRAEVYERRQAVIRWTKPMSYLEHLVLPRLHWLLDLELLDWNSFEALREFEPSTAGAYIIDQFPNLYEHSFVNRSWCQNTLFSAWAQGLGFEHTPWHSLSEDSQALLVEEYVEIGFRLFHTAVHYRISAYQLTLFIILKLLFERQILAGFEDIKQALSEFSKSGHIRWDFFWSTMDDDGYLILLRK